MPQTGDTAREAAAAKLVQCLNSPAEQLKMAEERDTVPTRTDVAAQFARQTPAMRTFVEMLPSLRARTGELGPKWPATATQIYNAIQTALTGGGTPMEALKQAKHG
ncbi:type 2 periplasmic-binding domain-containing protein [Phaeacidiphilus oryzae]|uniref:hypothetical protein n=1 Tax=Phaeacidiphilus oryzae TaxID=348818 RepID=UPI001F158396|nr:hypothetical protein [Phaeacidiphilus oryzae]